MTVRRRPSTTAAMRRRLLRPPLRASSLLSLLSPLALTAVPASSRPSVTSRGTEKISDLKRRLRTVTATGRSLGVRLDPAARARHVDAHRVLAGALEASEDKIVGVSMSTFMSVLTSDVDEEFGTDELSRSRVKELWEESALWDYWIAVQAEFRHLLGEEGVTEGDTQFPYLICVERINERQGLTTALSRMGAIYDWLEFEGLDVGDARRVLTVVYNTEDMTCFFERYRASVAVILMDHTSTNDRITQIPLNTYMKHRSGVVQEILRRAYPDRFQQPDTGSTNGNSTGGVPDIPEDDVDASETVSGSESSLDVVLCGGVSGEELARLGDKLGEFMRRKSSDGGQSLISSLSAWSNVSDSELADYPHRVAFWRRVYEVGIDSTQGCDSALDRLETAPIPGKVEGETLGVSVTLTDPGANQEEFDATVACILGLIAGVSLLPQVCSVELSPKLETSNLEAQWIVQGSHRNVKRRHFWEEGIDGKGEVVAISDTGIDVDNCYFWDSVNRLTKDGSYVTNHRKVIQYVPYIDDADDPSGHGTHCAGTIAGHKAGQGTIQSDGKADGVAREAKLAFMDLSSGGPALSIPGNKRRLLEVGYEQGARIHSASWGGPLSPYRYDTMSRDIDQLLHDDVDMLMVVAAGNGGQGDAIRTLGSPAVAKNVLAVGASQSDGPDLAPGQQGPRYVAPFSSRGPTPDGRIGPHVLAPGQSILSANSIPTATGECDPDVPPRGGTGTTAGLTYKQGTSMAAPAAAGAAALVRQYFREGYYPTGIKNSTNAFEPTGQLVKAVMINGARQAMGVDNGGRVTPSWYYDEHQGFGSLSLLHSLPLRGQNWINAYVLNSFAIGDGLTRTIPISIDKNNSCTEKEMRATLVWADPPGASGCVKCLVNDLDLTIVSNPANRTAETFYPNGRKSKDSTNNVERIIVPAENGDRFDVKLFAANLDRGEQSYSLIITGCITYEGDDADLGVFAVSGAGRGAGGWQAAVAAGMACVAASFLLGVGWIL